MLGVIEFRVFECGGWVEDGINVSSQDCFAKSGASEVMLVFETNLFILVNIFKIRCEYCHQIIYQVLKSNIF